MLSAARASVHRDATDRPSGDRRCAGGAACRAGLLGLVDDTLYITIDRKPKRASDRPLKRLGNILENPQAAIVFDHYDEDWRRLAWVMLRGRAEILADGPEHGRAQALLQGRYRQLAAMQIAGLPVIAIRIERTASWGDLGD